MRYVKSLFSGVLGFVVASTGAFADADKCANIEYKLANPDECPQQSFFTTGTVLGIGGGLAAVGGVAALIGMAGSGSSGSSGGSTAPSVVSTVSFRSPALRDSTPLVFDDENEYITNIDDITNSAYYKKNTVQYDAIGLKYAHARGNTGTGSTIKIMDDFVSAGISHGTKVSYFAQNIAPDADVYNVNVANTNHSLNFEQFASNIDSTKSIYNVSWEIQNVFATQATTRDTISSITGDAFITQMANAAKQYDSIFVVAAGNSGMNESSALSALPIAVDELYGHFINVVALDTNTNELATYSNQCGITQDYCITAPGSALKTDAYEYVTVNGTSFAAPIVSGAIAILQDKFPYLQSSQITEILLRTATDLGDTGIDSVYGWGLLNLDQATKPVGELSVASVSGQIVQRLATANVTPAIAASIAKSGATMAAFDEYGRAYTQNLTDNIRVINRSRGFDRLRRTQNDNTKILEFGSSNINLLEGNGFMQIDSSQNGYIATNYSFDLTNSTKLFTRGQFGIMSARPAPESIINNFSNIFIASATVGLEHGDWKLEIAMPETIVSGNMNMSLAQNRMNDGSIAFANYNFDLATKPSFEYALSYKNLTAGFVDNPIGTDEFYILAKTKLVF